MASDDEKISPEEFDLIVCGTGLQEALMAGAAAQAGKRVLHVDHAGSYGSFWKAHTLDSLLQWTSSLQHGNAQQCARSSSPSQERRLECSFPVYSNVSLLQAEGAKFGPSRDYNLDLAPKAAYCDGALVAALVASGGHNYTEFKALRSSYLLKNGQLLPLPASRSDVFAMTGMSLQHRRSLTRFLTSVQAAINGETQQVLDTANTPTSASAFGDRPFADLLKEQGISTEVRELLYALMLLDSDQEPSVTAADDDAHRQKQMTTAKTTQSDSCLSVVTVSRTATAKEGLAALQMHVQSAAKFGPSASALLLPCYGTAELPQTFCRVAAVAGAVYVLRCPLLEVCLDSSSSSPRINRVKTAAGQTLTCCAFAGNVESFAGCNARWALPPPMTKFSKVARAIAIIDSPIVQGSGNSDAALVVSLPHSLPSHNAATVRVLQVGSDTSSAPAGRWVLYASTPVATTHQSSASISAALKDTRAALEQLVQLPPSNPDTAPDPTTPDQGGDSTEAAVDSEASAAEQKGRPKALLLVSYLQCTLGLQQDSLPINAVCSTPPDGSLDYGSAVSEAAASYARLFPAESAATGGALFGRTSSGAARKEGQPDQLTSASSGDSSDDDTLKALQNALQTLGTPE